MLPSEGERTPAKTDEGGYTTLDDAAETQKSAT
jgi:hypothetical protein